jgi:transcription antitermination factor NusG
MVREQIATFTQGELVRILSGPFSGLVGKLEAVSEDHRILKISLRFFGRRHTAEVLLMDVEKVV